MSMPAQQTHDQDQERSLIIAVILLLLLLFLLYLFTPQLNAMAGAVAWVHLKPLEMAAGHVPALLSLPFLGGWLFEPAVLVTGFLEEGGFAGMRTDQRSLVLTAAGRVAFLLYAPPLVAAALMGREFRPDVAYRGPLTLETMIRTQSEHWTTTRLTRHVNPLKLPEISASRILQRIDPARVAGQDTAWTPATRGVVVPDAWQRALRPEEYLLAHGLCLNPVMVEAARASGWSLPDRALENRDAWAGLDMDTLSEVLSLQLRHPWTGSFDGLRPVHRAVAAVMALFHAYDIDGGNALAKDIAIVNDGIRGRSGGMDAALMAESALSGRMDSILKGKPGKGLLEVASGHAWLESAFPAMLAASRDKRGVLPAALFLWMKAEDRLMWYILDSVGSEAIMVEAAGAIAHWRAEAQIGEPIARPAVYQTARALLEDYLDVTPDRLKMKRARAERRRRPGEDIDGILAGISAQAGRPKKEGDLAA